MKNCTISNSAQISMTKTARHHSTYSDLFAGSYLLTVQKFASEYYAVKWIIKTIG